MILFLVGMENRNIILLDSTLPTQVRTPYASDGCAQIRLSILLTLDYHSTQLARGTTVGGCNISGNASA